MMRVGRRGFTLLEVAIALAVLGVGLVSVMQIFSGALRVQDRASRQTRVVLAARAAMDSLLRRPGAALPRDGACEHVGPTAEGFQLELCASEAGVDEGFTDEDLESDVNFKPMVLRVSVAWQDGTSPKSYVLESLRLVPEDVFS